MSKISVIVPVYKVEKYLQRCIDSILNQTFTDFEIILVDDGSPDNCGKICDEYADKDNRIKVIHQENGGLSAARNAGLDWANEKSDSEWISFIDSDDWIHPRYLELLYSSAVESGVKISVCNFDAVQKYTESVNIIQNNYKMIKTEDFYCSNAVVAVVAYCKLYKKNEFGTIRFPEGCIHEDEVTTYKILFQVKEVCYVDIPLYMYFQNEDGIMHTPNYSARIKVYPLLKERHQFFKDNGFKNAYYKSKETELKVLYRLYKDAEFTSGYEKEKKRVKNQMRLFLLRNYKQFPIKLKPHIYRIVFKRITKLYWYKEAIKEKIIIF